MGSVVYKQRYVSISETDVIARNAAHLLYIATRPGAIYNPCCGFGLWGSLELKADAENINNLENAKSIVKEASKSHTIYRGIVSLEHEDAMKHGYYEREAWQKLICEKIDVIRKEMDIDSKDFRWCASYHHEKEHPHIHIMFWDDSDKIRNEFIPDERFEIMSEKIRAEFNREIFHDEIRNLQQAQGEVFEKLKDDFEKELKAFMPGIKVNMEFNETAEPQEEKREVGQEVLAIRYISEEKLLQFCERMIEIEETLPKKGALKYAYLPTDAKTTIDKFTDELLGTDAFSKLKHEYLQLARSVAEQYGNGEESVAHFAAKAEDKLRNVLGNQILNYMKQNDIIETLKKGGLRGADDEVKKFLMQNLVGELSEDKVDEIETAYSGSVLDGIGKSADSLRNVNTDVGKAYAKFVAAMPERLTPAKEWLNGDNRKLFYDCCYKLMKTEPLKKQMGKYAAFKAGTFDFKGTIEQKTEIADYFNNKKGNAVKTVEVDSVDKKLAEKYALSKAFSELYKECSSLIYNQAKEDKGWVAQERCNLAVCGLMQLFRGFEKDMRNERGHLPALFQNEKSKQAKKEISLKLKSKGLDWGDEH